LLASETTIRSAREGRDSAFDLTGFAQVDRVYLHSEEWGHSLDDGKRTGSGGALGGIPKDRHSRDPRRNIFEQLQKFRVQTVFTGHEPGRVAAGPRQAFDVPGGDRIGDDRKHYRYAAGQLQQRAHREGAMRQDDVWREGNQLLRVSMNVVGLGSPMSVDPHIPAYDPARLRQSLLERTDPGLIVRIIRHRAQKHADAPHAVALLRAR
jgi:hypothetical protein